MVVLVCLVALECYPAPFSVCNLDEPVIVAGNHKVGKDLERKGLDTLLLKRHHITRCKILQQVVNFHEARGLVHLHENRLFQPNAETRKQMLLGLCSPEGVGRPDNAPENVENGAFSPSLRPCNQHCYTRLHVGPLQDVGKVVQHEVAGAIAKHVETVLGVLVVELCRIFGWHRGHACGRNVCPGVEFAVTFNARALGWIKFQLRGRLDRLVGLPSVEERQLYGSPARDGATFLGWGIILVAEVVLVFHSPLQISLGHWLEVVVVPVYKHLDEVERELNFAELSLDIGLDHFVRLVFFAKQVVVPLDKQSLQGLECKALPVIIEG
mmetsp:Transcript_23540/g.59119  ORF Transcript_23540/g.59119 Transcript_23540/m.59119 type:complete len:325 (+) Transcript_23540:1231-2205(+)